MKNIIETDSDLTLRQIQSGSEKNAQSLMHRHFQPFAVESRGFHQTAQKRSLSTSQCTICIIWLNIL